MNEQNEHIVAVFDTQAHADAAEADLIAAGIPRASIARYRPGDVDAPATQVAETIQPATSTPMRTTPTSGGGFWSKIFGSDAETHEDRNLYAEHERSGRIIVSVTAMSSAEAAEVSRVLMRHVPEELQSSPSGTPASSTMSGIDARSATTTRTETLADTGLPPASTSGTVTQETAPVRSNELLTEPVATPAAATRPNVATPAGAEEVVALSEEQLSVGTRVVERGTTRIRRYVVSRPVEEQVKLREERVSIERRAPTTAVAGDVNAFEEKTIEVRETAEVPVVEKTARVVEEVVVKREGTERTETVRDSVRKEEIEVEEAGKTGVTDTGRVANTGTI